MSSHYSTSLLDNICLFAVAIAYKSKFVLEGGGGGSRSNDRKKFTAAESIFVGARTPNQ